MRNQLLTLNQLVQLLDPELYLHLESADSSNFFFFRPLLVWFKREFDWPDVLRLWEALWTDFLSGSFHIFIAMAILEKHRDIILNHLKAFDEVLKYCKLAPTPHPCTSSFCDLTLTARIVNDLSGSIDLVSTLTRAEALFYRFQKSVDAIDRKNKSDFVFPEPPSPVRHRKPDPGPSTSRPRQTQSASTSSSAAAGSSNGAGGIQRTEVITPELRWLLKKEPKKYGQEAQEAEPSSPGAS